MAELGFPVPAEQTVNFIFHYAIALTDARLEAMAIHNADAATAVMDHSGVLKVSGGYRHALAASTQHMSDQLLSSANPSGYSGRDTAAASGRAAVQPNAGDCIQRFGKPA